jgi:hypothetical protein
MRVVWDEEIVLARVNDGIKYLVRMGEFLFDKTEKKNNDRFIEFTEICIRIKIMLFGQFEYCTVMQICVPCVMANQDSST